MGHDRSHLLALTGVSLMNSRHAAELHRFVAMEAKNSGLLISHTVRISRAKMKDYKFLKMNHLEINYEL